MYNPNNDPECSECGCIGNAQCGAEPVAGHCSLDECLVCPCCNTLGKAENMERWIENIKPDADQIVLEL